MFGNKQLEFQIMTMQRDLDDAKNTIKELEHRIAEIEKKPPVNVRSEGEPFFADKRVQLIVYGAVASVLMAAVASFTGGVGWLG